MTAVSYMTNSHPFKTKIIHTKFFERFFVNNLFRKRMRASWQARIRAVTIASCGLSVARRSCMISTPGATNKRSS